MITRRIYSFFKSKYRFNSIIFRLLKKYTYKLNKQFKKRKGITRSHFFPDAAIFKGHPRFRTLSNNIRQRKGKTVNIQVPVYVDKSTKQPFREDSATYEGRARDNCVFMDATGFGMGCCCLQTTFQVNK